MAKLSVDDYLEQGIYGKKEFKPGERKKFLGTFRERVIVALYQSQMYEKQVKPEIVSLFKKHNSAILLLNGHIDYSHLVKYIKTANQYNISYKVVMNKEYNSELGLVFAESYAIDKENIYLTDENKEIKKAVKKSFWQRILQLLKWKNNILH